MTSTVELPVRGEVPGEMAGTLLQAYPHPGLCSRAHAADAPLAVSGIRFRGGQVSWYQVEAGVRRPCPFVGPVADLGETVRLAGLPETDTDGARATAAWPVRDPEGPYWHTVVTYADRRHADHLVLADGGTVLQSRRFPLEHAPLMHTVAVTERHIVLLDLPVSYHKAAAMVGERSPYAWEPGRPARIGILPLDADNDAAPRWFDIDPGYTFRTVNAFDDGDRVVVDLLWHQGKPDGALPAPGPAPVVRWTVDTRTGQASGTTLTGEVDVAVVDPRLAGRQYRFLLTVAGGTIARHDLDTGAVTTRELGAGRRAGQPVLVPDTSDAAGSGWVTAFVEDVAHRTVTALVLDAQNLNGPAVAEIPLPEGVTASPRATWISGRPAAL